MSNLPIAAAFARDAVERQFRPENPRVGEKHLGAQPARRPARSAAAALLRRLADRLEPRRVSPGPSH